MSFSLFRTSWRHWLSRIAAPSTGCCLRAASETLLTLARDPKHLGAKIGCLALLHTWGQNLLAHPHLHCVIPGGGISISPDGERWVSCRDGFFLPVRVLSRMFRGKFLAMLIQAYEKNELDFHGQLADLHHPKAGRDGSSLYETRNGSSTQSHLSAAPNKCSSTSPGTTHRVAISNRRILSTDNGTVTFTWKDYASGNTRRTMTLDAQEFLRRFLLHVLPSRFTRIRYYGFLANRNRAENIRRARLLIDANAADSAAIQTSSHETVADAQLHTALPSDDQFELCPQCKQGHLILILRVGYPAKHETWSFDSS